MDKMDKPKYRRILSTELNPGCLKELSLGEPEVQLTSFSSIFVEAAVECAPKVMIRRRGYGHLSCRELLLIVRKPIFKGSMLVNLAQNTLCQYRKEFQRSRYVPCSNSNSLSIGPASIMILWMRTHRTGSSSTL